MLAILLFVELGRPKIYMLKLVKKNGQENATQLITPRLLIYKTHVGGHGEGKENVLD